jgi:hypothetical protein
MWWIIWGAIFYSLFSLFEKYLKIIFKIHFQNKKFKVEKFCVFKTPLPF